MPANKLVGVVCTVDITKDDAEIKLLIGCTERDINMVDRFLNNDYMSAVVIKRIQITL